MSDINWCVFKLIWYNASIYKPLKWIVFIAEVYVLFHFRLPIYLFLKWSKGDNSKTLGLSSDSSRAKHHKALDISARTVRFQSTWKCWCQTSPLVRCPSQPGCRLPRIWAMHYTVPNNQGGDNSILPLASPHGVLVFYVVLCLISYWHYTAWNARECMSLTPAI